MGGRLSQSAACLLVVYTESSIAEYKTKGRKCYIQIWTQPFTFYMKICLSWCHCDMDSVLLDWRRIRGHFYLRYEHFDLQYVNLFLTYLFQMIST